jgi:signal transduction histidine kinase
VNWFRNVSLSSKLIGINLFTSVSAVLLACSGFVFYEVSSFRDSAVREAAATASVVTETSKAAVLFRDAAAAERLLAGLEPQARVRNACLYSADGALLSTFQRTASERCPGVAPAAAAPAFVGETLVVIQRIQLRGQAIGTFLLVRDTGDISERLMHYAQIVVLVGGVCLLLALLMSVLLQRVVSRPIIALTQTASTVSSDRNYSIRAQAASNDEIGTLVRQFNEMLDEIHKREMDLQSAQDHLEARVAERTRELSDEIQEHKQTQRDLVAAKEAAEDANRAKSSFLARMSHELRTPLNIIIGYTDLLQVETPGQGLAGFASDLARIRQAGKQLLELINDVLDLSKIEAGRMEVQITGFEAGGLAHEIAGAVEPLARRNRNTVVLRYDAGPSVLWTDETKLRQILLNLLSNACKFTENGTVVLQVSRTEQCGHGWLTWEVCDTGIGIAPEQMGRLFEAFYQVDGSATRRYGGTGLGLAISQRLCHMIGGRIEVESEPGKGSRFAVHLPLDEVPHSSRAGNNPSEALTHAISEPSPA